MNETRIIRYPVCFQTVDIAVIRNEELLLARKKHENLWRFIGGFSDPNSQSLEIDAKREVSEEADIEIDDLHYLGSTLVPDKRYEEGPDKIKTALFVAKYISGYAKAKDDIFETKWIKLNDLKKEDIMPVHHVLVDMFKEKFIKNEQLFCKYVKQLY